MKLDINKKYFAICKPDADTPDGLILFRSKRLIGELWFIADCDELCRYRAKVIVQDKDWYFWERKS